MIRFGIACGLNGAPEDFMRPGWTAFAARATFRPELATGKETICEFSAGGETFWLGCSAGRSVTGTGPAPRRTARATMHADTLQALIRLEFSPQQAVESGLIDTDGDADVFFAVAAMYAPQPYTADGHPDNELDR